MLDILGLDIMGLDIMGLDIMGLDILGLDILGLDILGLIQSYSVKQNIKLEWPNAKRYKRRKLPGWSPGNKDEVSIICFPHNTCT